MNKIPVTSSGAAVFVVAVALTVREAEKQSRPLSGKTFLELILQQLNAFLDGTSPYLQHRALSVRDQATVIKMQSLLVESVESDDLDFLIP